VDLLSDVLQGDDGHLDRLDVGDVPVGEIQMGALLQPVHSRELRETAIASRAKDPLPIPHPHNREWASLRRERHIVNAQPALTGSPQAERGSRMHVGQAREQYVRWLLVAKDLSPHTIRAYDSDIAALERHLGIRALVRQINRDCLVAFMEEQRAAGLSPMSLRRRSAGLRGFCKWLLSSRLLDSDPSVGAHIAVGRSRALPRIVPTQELDRLFLSLLKTAGVDDASDSGEVLHRPHESTTLLAVALMVVTGARVSEVVGIKCRDIDLPGRSLRIVGKGRRERQVFLANDWITSLTRAYLNTRAALGIDNSQLLFNWHHDALTAPAMRLRLVKAARDAGLSARVTPHMLRHTAATQLIEAGVDIRYIQRLLGHASLTTTEIYTHVSDRALGRVVSDADVLGRLLQPR
jgi:integrase/recombinase XerC